MEEKNNHETGNKLNFPQLTEEKLDGLMFNIALGMGKLKYNTMENENTSNSGRTYRMHEQSNMFPYPKMKFDMNKHRSISNTQEQIEGFEGKVETNYNPITIEENKQNKSYIMQGTKFGTLGVQIPGQLLEGETLEKAIKKYQLEPTDKNFYSFVAKKDMRINYKADKDLFEINVEYAVQDFQKAEELISDVVDILVPNYKN